MLEIRVHALYFHEDSKCLGHTNHHRYFLEKISIRHRELMTILVLKHILSCRKSKDCTVVRKLKHKSNYDHSYSHRQEIYILLKKYYCMNLNFYPKISFADHKDLLISTVNPIYFHRTCIYITTRNYATINITQFKYK